ncbi:hypothetical protein CYY_003352 [Polysphondylium violaceum]|uniref:Palmitoyltransferase n=1 Tax=Polysphondylium violaceum TaxID=133409 RepID=A0A8J4PWI5_9MYCE|nr:hypothetical protein CYY_003352 [Polysphondylium violaceum]
MIDVFYIVVFAIIVILLPLVTDALNNLFPNAKIGRIAQEVVGFLLVFVIITLIFIAVFLWYSVFLPYYFIGKIDYYNVFDILAEPNKQPNALGLCCQLIFTLIMVSNVYYYYYQSITTNTWLPKISKKKQDDTLTSQQRETSLCSQCTESGNGGSGWSTLKKEKSHHCRICKRCVDTMDHHCPFISNCVGKANHHYFFLFLAWTCIGVLYACFMSYYPFRDCLLINDWDAGQISTCIALGNFNFIFICSCVVMAPLAVIILWQFYLLYTSTTTVYLLRTLKHSPSYSNYLKWLYTTFKQKGSISNFKSIFINWRFYNFILPYYLN